VKISRSYQYRAVESGGRVYKLPLRDFFPHRFVAILVLAAGPAKYSFVLIQHTLMGQIRHGIFLLDGCQKIGPARSLRLDRIILGGLADQLRRTIKHSFGKIDTIARTAFERAVFEFAGND